MSAEFNVEPIPVRKTVAPFNRGDIVYVTWTRGHHGVIETAFGRFWDETDTAVYFERMHTPKYSMTEVGRQFLIKMEKVEHSDWA